MKKISQKKTNNYKKGSYHVLHFDNCGSMRYYNQNKMKQFIEKLRWHIIVLKTAKNEQVGISVLPRLPLSVIRIRFAHPSRRICLIVDETD